MKEEACVKQTLNWRTKWKRRVIMDEKCYFQKRNKNTRNMSLCRFESNFSCWFFDFEDYRWDDSSEFFRIHWCGHVMCSGCWSSIFLKSCRRRITKVQWTCGIKSSSGHHRNGKSIVTVVDSGEATNQWSHVPFSHFPRFAQSIQTSQNFRSPFKQSACFFDSFLPFSTYKSWFPWHEWFWMLNSRH